LRNIVNEAVTSLGLPKHATVESRLESLVLDALGGATESLHKDDSAAAGSRNFAIMELQLPCFYQGGAATVATNTLQLKIIGEQCVQECRDAYFATTYLVDCQRQTEPLTTGCRLYLRYHLSLSAADSQAISPPTAAKFEDHLQAIRELATSWPKSTTRGYLLEDDCSGDVSELWFERLRGHDRRVVDFLRLATDSDGHPLFVVYLALLEKWESGYVNDGEMEFVSDRRTGIKSIVGTDGNFSDEVKVPFEMEWDLLHSGEDADDIFGDEPDEVINDELQDGEGDDSEFTFYRAAVLFWPQSFGDTISLSKRSLNGDGSVAKRIRIEEANVDGAGREENPYVLD
jgi:hypothetical protein